MHNAKLAAALAMAERGFRVFPLPPNGTRPSAEWKGWPEHATTNPAQICAWWEGTDCNIGVCTTGLLVVDLDQKKGRDGLATWMRLHGGFDTLTVRTKSGGYHLYYRGADVANSVGELGEGLDIRSHNGYVVAPGSTVDGAPYEVVIDDAVAPAPAEIVALCKPPGQRAENAAAMLVETDTPAALSLAVQKIAATQGAVRGEQSEQAYKLACAVRDFGISEAVCAALMDEWAARCSPPISPDDLRGRVANAYAYAQNPGGAKHPEAAFGEIALPPLPPSPTPQDTQHEQAARSGLRLLTADECADTGPRGYVVKNVIAPGQLGCIFGQPGAGKSVLAPHLAYAVAQGRAAFGQRTKKGGVFYVCAEDEAGMRQRVAALRKRHGAAPDFHLVAGVSSLLDPERGDLARLQQLAEEHKPSLIVVDTLAAAAPGLDENASADMSRIVDAMRSLTLQGAAVLLVHHSPKSGDTPHGHSVLNGALDMSMLVAADPAAEGVIRGQLQKNRNGPCTLDIAFRIDAAAMGQDEDGDAVTAPICLERTAEEVRADRKQKMSKTEAATERVLVERAIAHLPPNAPVDPANLPPVPVEEWAGMCEEPGIICERKERRDRRKAFNETRNGLLAKNRVMIRDGYAIYLGHGCEDWGKRRPDNSSPFGLIVVPPPVPKHAEHGSGDAATRRSSPPIMPAAMVGTMALAGAAAIALA